MRWLSVLSMTALLSAAGCQNNTIELTFDDAGNESSGDGSGTTAMDGDDDGVTPTTVAVTTATADTGVTPGGPQTLLMAIDTVLAPGLPFQALVTTNPTDTTVDLTLQFLSLDIGSTTFPRQPVGDVYAYPGVPLEADGSFVWNVGVILVPGAANPLTGSDMVVALTIAARPEGMPYCGEAGGTVTSPIEAPIDGSTHAMTEVFDPNNLPVDFPTSCPP